METIFGHNWYLLFTLFLTYFLPPSHPEIEDYLPSLHTEQNLSNLYIEFRFAINLIFLSGNDLESKFGSAKIQGRGGGRVLLIKNCKNYSFLSQYIDKLKLYNIFKNQPFTSIRRGRMRVSHFLIFEKKGCSFPISPPN